MDFASLVVLSYKRPEMLQRTLVSLLNSTPRVHYELIVVDDGSRDANWPFLAQALRQREVSTVIFNAGNNLGVGVGMNRGFGVARGKWVAKLDADLDYRPGWLDAGVQLLECFPRLAAVGFFDYRNYVPDDSRFNRLRPLEHEGQVVGHVVDDFVGSAFLLRRADWLHFGVAGVAFDHAVADVRLNEVHWQGFEEGSAAFAEDVAWKRKMQALGYELAITGEDYVTNFGFGLGRSTVVVADESGQPTVAKISPLPLLFGGRGRRD